MLTQESDEAWQKNREPELWKKETFSVHVKTTVMIYWSVGVVLWLILTFRICWFHLSIEWDRGISSSVYLPSALVRHKDCTIHGRSVCDITYLSLKLSYETYQCR